MSTLPAYFQFHQTARVEIIADETDTNTIQSGNKCIKHVLPAKVVKEIIKKISNIPKKTSGSDLIMASDIPKEMIKSIETIMTNTDIFYAMTRKKN
jgi:hypothetical protein